MSAGSTLQTVDFDRELWLDVEVPANLIEDNWNDEYRSELKEFADSQRIVGTELEVYWRLFRDDEPPRQKTQIVEEILSHDEEWGMSLRSAYWFSNGKTSEYVSHFFERIEGDVDGTDLEDLYADFRDNGRKFGQVLLLHLFAPDSLKSILALDYCYGKKPYSQSRSGTRPSDPLGDIDADAILNQLRSDSRRYQAWHRFTFDNRDYFAIKRHLRDEVERQVDENQPLETAEFVVVKFREDLLEIYSDRRRIAERTRVGVNRSFSDDSDVEYEPLDRTASHDHFDDPDQQIRSLEEDSDTFTVTGIKAENAPLSGSPTLELSSRGGILDALDDLANSNIDLLEDLDDVSSFQVYYENRSFDLYPERKEASDGEMRWRLRYDSRFPTDEDRDEFEAEVEEALGIRPVFEHS